MTSKKHGNESLSDSEAEQDKEDFFYACERTAEMLKEFSARGLQIGPALGGALTQIIAHLLTVSPDTTAAMQLLSSCIDNATLNVQNSAATHHGSNEIH